MGVSYYQPVSQWWVGPTPNGCTNLQNDFSVLQGILGLRLTTLAIDFITFKVENNAAFWEVSDINSIQYFIVEKSDDGINFYQIGKVPINNQRKYSYLW